VKGGISIHAAIQIARNTASMTQMMKS